MRTLAHPPAEALHLPNVLHAMSDPVRLDIVRALHERGELSCSHLGAPVSKSTLSHHLKVLRDAGVITEDKRGRERLYRLRPEALREVVDWIEGYRSFWQSNLTPLKRYLEDNS